MSSSDSFAEGGPLRIVLVGSGRTGLRVARVLAARDHDVVVVERRADRVELISEEYIATVIQGDATRPSILRQADLNETDVVAGLTDTTATNLAACSIAKQVNPEIRTVMRTVHDETGEYDEFVDETFLPEQGGARVAVNTIERGIQTVEGHIGEIEVISVEVSTDAPVVGRSLNEIKLPRGSLVVTGPEGDRIADSDTELLAGHSYMIAVEPSVIDEVVALFRG